MEVKRSVCGRLFNYFWTEAANPQSVKVHQQMRRRLFVEGFHNVKSLLIVIFRHVAGVSCFSLFLFMALRW